MGTQSDVLKQQIRDYADSLADADCDDERTSKVEIVVAPSSTREGPVKIGVAVITLLGAAAAVAEALRGAGFLGK